MHSRTEVSSVAQQTAAPKKLFITTGAAEVNIILANAMD